ncbi:MAG: response regulator [Candidatus Omnitrophica bacterium]|nr:response regulator [Candidatus Omnitrophota bacterium]
MAKVLVVDDEKSICEEFRDILEEENHQVDIAFRGKEAIEKIRHNTYDLVFLDMLMPQAEGCRVLEEIKKIKSVPVAVMSGFLPPAKEREVKAMGVVACLSKPLDLTDVRNLLKSIEPPKNS